MSDALLLYLLGAAFGVVGSDAYDRNRWAGRCIWLLGGLCGWAFATWRGMA